MYNLTLKHLLILVFFIITSITINAEIIKLKDGTILKGSIIGVEADTILIKSQFGDIKVEKSKIEKTYFSDDEYNADINKASATIIQFENSSTTKEQTTIDILNEKEFEHYNKYFVKRWKLDFNLVDYK